VIRDWLFAIGVSLLGSSCVMILFFSALALSARGEFEAAIITLTGGLMVFGLSIVAVIWLRHWLRQRRAMKAEQARR
jgi:uncharacterized membrane protein YciS (DUF1049 family)